MGVQLMYILTYVRLTVKKDYIEWWQMFDMWHPALLSCTLSSFCIWLAGILYHGHTTDIHRTYMYILMKTVN